MPPDNYALIKKGLIDAPGSISQALCEANDDAADLLATLEDFNQSVSDGPT